MNRAITCGMVLLAFSAFAGRNLWALDGPTSTGAQYFVGGSGNNHLAQGYLGVDVRDVTAEQVPILKLKEARGAEITLVDHDAPAGKAGLREHDVVLQMNGQNIEGQDQIRRMLHDCPPGRTVTLVISRAGQQMTVTTQMSSHEEVERQVWQDHINVQGPDGQLETADASAAGAARSGNSFVGNLHISPSYTGAILEKVTAQLAGYFGVTEGSGLLVRSVIPNSPAALAGMQAGDVVIRADDRSVATSSEWAKCIKGAHGRPVKVTVVRDKKEQTLMLMPEGKKHSSLNPRPERPGTQVASLGLS